MDIPGLGTRTAARGEKSWPRAGNSDGHSRGGSVAAYGESDVAAVTFPDRMS